MRLPCSRISPPLLPKRPLIRLNKVLLPAPFGPITATRSPGITARLAPRMISVRPKLLRTSRSSIAGAAAVMPSASRRWISLSISSWMRPHSGTKRRRASSKSSTPTPSTTPAPTQLLQTLAFSGTPAKLQFRPEHLVQLQVVDHLDHRAGPGQRHQRAEQQHQVRPQQLPQLAERRHTQVHHDQAGDAARRVHHHEGEHQAQVQQPGLGQLGQQHQRQHQQHGADDRAEEEHGAAQEGEQQVGARARRTDHLRGDDLEVQRRQPAGDAHEEARGDERDVAHVARVVADEFDALGVVARGVEHAPQRRAREGEHQPPCRRRCRSRSGSTAATAARR